MSAVRGGARGDRGDRRWPVLATTLRLVVIFVPVSFMSSISGRFLYQFGITAAVAILVSLLVSFTLTPMMSARMLARRATHERRTTTAASRAGLLRLASTAATRALLRLVACAIASAGRVLGRRR